MISRLTAKMPKWSLNGGGGFRSLLRRVSWQGRLGSALKIRKQKTYLVMKFGKNSLDCLLARGRRDKQPVAVQRDLTGVHGNPEQLHQVLTDLVVEFGLRSPLVLLVLDQEEVLSRQLSLPTGDPGEIDAMIPFQAEALLPMPLEEFILNHRVCGQDEEGKTCVLLEAVPCKLVEDRLALLAASGFSVAGVRSSADLAGVLAGEGTELVPPTLQLGRVARAQRRRTFLTTLLALYCLSVATFVTEWRFSTRQESLAENQGYLQATEAGARQLAEMRAVTERLDNKGAENTGSLELLAHVCSAAPSGIMIFEVALVRDESTVIHGEAATADQALDFVEALKEKPGCGQAVLEFAGARGRNASGGTTFEIKIKH